MKGIVSISDNQRPETSGLVQIAKALALGKGFRDAAAAVAEAQGMSSRVLTVLKAAVPAGTTTGWGAELVDNQILVGAFISLLRNNSAFYRLLDGGGMVRLPFKTRIGIVTQGVTAWIVREGKPTPLRALGFNSDLLEPQMAAAMVVLSDELVRASQAESLISHELRRGIAATVDSQFFDDMIDGDTPTQASAGADGAIADLRFLFDAVDLKAESRPLLVMAPDVGRAASLLVGAGGQFVFPDMGPLGGTMRQVPAMVSDGLAEGTVALVDATGIGGESETINIEASSDTTVEMADNPSNDASSGTGSNLVSMFQTNSTAILAKAFFGAKRLRDNAMATVTNVDWGAGA